MTLEALYIFNIKELNENKCFTFCKFSREHLNYSHILSLYQPFQILKIKNKSFLSPPNNILTKDARGFVKWVAVCFVYFSVLGNVSLEFRTLKSMSEDTGIWWQTPVVLYVLAGQCVLWQWELKLSNFHVVEIFSLSKRLLWHM